ncbi:MAG: hydroxymethylbilane synthase [Elusimicrobia bacterium]|nr:hydroxymethylbilane synthase [Elusimicrobiota bacterium]
MTERLLEHRIGTRASPLATAQAQWLRAKLAARYPEHAFRLCPIQTAGDLHPQGHPQYPPQSSGYGGPPEAGLLRQGGKGVFVKELDEALGRGEIDLAVHSAKDVPAELTGGLQIVCFPQREDPHDVVLGEIFPGCRVGTSSLRRQIQLRRICPRIEEVPLRGNVGTRLGKLAAAECHAVVLALAGLRRLGKADIPFRILDEEEMVPAPGQGALAVVARRDRPEILDLLAPLEDLVCRVEVEAERSFMKAMGGGCRMPLGALARCEGNWVRLRVFWSDPDGKNPLFLAGKDKVQSAVRLGEQLAERILEMAR